MSNRRKTRKGWARGAHSRTQSDDLLFELALRGEGENLYKPFDPKADRKTLQLCRQVQRALMLALAGECGDDLLRDVSVESVNPAGGARHLLVRVNVPNDLSVMEVLARLNDRVGQLRASVAASICRKRVPMLTFVCVPPVESNAQKSDKKGSLPILSDSDTPSIQRTKRGHFPFCPIQIPLQFKLILQNRTKGEVTPFCPNWRNRDRRNSK